MIASARPLVPLLAVALAPFVVLANRAQSLPEPPPLLSKTMCDVPVETPKGGFLLQPGYWLEIVRFEGKTENVVLLRAEKALPEQCVGRAVAELRMPPHALDEFAFYPCTDRGGHANLVGLGTNDNGRRERFRPRLAWRVNLKTPRFVPVDATNVVCVWRGLD